MFFFVIEQLAILTPESVRTYYLWLGNSVCDWLASRVLELSYTNIELAPLAQKMGFPHPPFKWQPERRRLLQAEIDSLILHLYGLTRSQTEWLLDSFTVLHKYEEHDFGEYRTRRLVLEIHDSLQESIHAGKLYQTRLDPPPADSRCCHPPRGPERKEE
jgi:hypothetical protein